MNRLPKIALVGEPSVGKSTLFNRLVSERKAIVGETRGITRDRLYGTGNWLDNSFIVIDTGGITLDNAPFSKLIKAQAEIAAKEADVIVFVVDGRKGIDDDTQTVAKILRPYRDRVVLAVNKIDDQTLLGDAYSFYSLGFGDPYPIAADKAIGVGDLLDAVVKKFPKEMQEEKPQAEKGLSFAVIGRPNVGKSSLINAILGTDRVMVSPMAGTTRDAVDTYFVRDGKPYVAVDTAGLKKKGKIYEAIDKYAALRALSAVEKADVVICVIEADTEFSAQDSHIIGIATEANKPMIIVVNKWDLHSHGINDQQTYRKNLTYYVPFAAFCPVVFTSALEHKGMAKIFDAMDTVYRQAGIRVPTALLNQVVSDAQLANETPLFHGGRLKIGYATQTGTFPPTFVLFVNNPDFMHFSYERYLEKTFRTQFGMDSVPIKIVCRTKQTGGFKL